MFKLGYKALKRLCQEQLQLGWQNAKLTTELFKGAEEVEAFKWVSNHVDKFHNLPQLVTLLEKFPEMKEFEVPEPSSYYTDKLDNRFAYDLVNAANIKSQNLLKEDKTKVTEAMAVMQDCTDRITAQRYRHRILSMTKEAPKLILETYHNVNAAESTIQFGWPHMDDSGGVLPGDLISFIGRPAAGKTFLGLKSAISNWQKGNDILFVSMEMNALAIGQRITSMYTHTNLTGLKTSTYSSDVYKVFVPKLIGMAKEPADIYVVDGNLAATVDDIYRLAAQLKVRAIYIDGAYLLKHPNLRLDRFTKVAENTERMKQLTGDCGLPTFASWQFSREATKKAKKEEKVGLEDIGMSDAIGQCSSIVLGLFQEESVETMYRRLVDVMKGRNGEVGQFPINWDFQKMDFDEIIVGPQGLPQQAMEWL